MIRRSGNQLDSLGQEGNHATQLMRVVGTVTVDRAHDVGVGEANSSQDAGRNAPVVLVPGEAAVSPAAEQLLQHRPGAIGTAVVDKDKAKCVLSAPGSDYALQGVLEVAERLSLVE